LVQQGDSLATERARKGHKTAVSSGQAHEHPFAKLRQVHQRPFRVGILTDFTRIPYANGTVFQTKALYRSLNTCGHEATLVGPRDPDAAAHEMRGRVVALPSVPLRTYPGVHLPVPTDPSLFDPDRWSFDLCFAQTTTPLLELGLWLRKVRGTPLLCVNTTHLAAAYDVLLPETVSRIGAVHAVVQKTLRQPVERHFVNMYNQSDGLVVLSEGLKSYWRSLGVTAPVHVIPRMVPENFHRPIGSDPFVPLLERHGLDPKGPRILSAGRHTREKSQDRLIRIFAEHIYPREPNATLTLVGEGPDRAAYAALARRLGVEHRVLMPGEVPYSRIPDYYRHANVFVHASLSETFGNVLSEALWCGVPTVAFADGMGASSQIDADETGLLLEPGRTRAESEAADAAFAVAVRRVLHDAALAARLATNAAERAQARCSPIVVEGMLRDAFLSAVDHAKASGARGLAHAPRSHRWIETFRHFRSWLGTAGGIYALGHLRPAAAPRPRGMHQSFYV
jgi:glycosyltransferase involved in cell wall biosynthesis